MELQRMVLYIYTQYTLVQQKSLLLFNMYVFYLTTFLNTTKKMYSTFDHKNQFIFYSFLLEVLQLFFYTWSCKEKIFCT